ncbi:MAG: hypothetical protein ACREIA_03000, partial [Opitutaceae bacterium]
MVQDYDWADEVLHARIGRELYVKQFKNAKEAIAYGDRCWSKVLIDWRSYIERGLTKHENWWPGLYREWCRAQGREPDPAVLAFNTNLRNGPGRSAGSQRLGVRPPFLAPASIPLNP